MGRTVIGRTAKTRHFAVPSFPHEQTFHWSAACMPACCLACAAIGGLQPALPAYEGSWRDRGVAQGSPGLGSAASRGCSAVVSQSAHTQGPNRRGGFMAVIQQARRGCHAAAFQRGSSGHSQLHRNYSGLPGRRRPLRSAGFRMHNTHIPSPTALGTAASAVATTHQPLYRKVNSRALLT